MNAIELLESQHREVEDLFEAIEHGGEKGRERRRLVDELIRKIELHTKLEERIFYPEGKTADEEMTLEAYIEHGVVKDLIRKLTKMQASDESFMPTITVLKEVIEHHVKEEENEYFPECEKTLGEESLESLGDRMLDVVEKEEGRGTSPRRRKTTKKAA